MRITLRQFQVFRSVARHASYTRAAEELNLTQPAVFTQVKQLEEALGAPLLDRIGKRLHLTAAGRAVVETARETLEGIERLEMQLADLQGLRRGRLRIAIVSTVQYFLPRLLGEFCTANPGIEVALTVTNRQTVISRLAANEDDLCILGQPPDGMDLVATPIARNPIVVLAPGDHPLAGQAELAFARLADDAFLLREPGSGTRAAAERFFAETGVRPRVRMELGSNEAIKQAVLAGLGLAILSQDTMALEGETGRLVALRVQGFPLLRTWNVAYPRGKHLSVAAAAFLRFLVGHAGLSASLAAAQPPLR